MQVLRPEAEPNEFFKRLAQAKHSALLLDYDGTLAPFQLDPRTAVPYPGIRERLDAIMTETPTRVVMISGRWTRDLVPLLGLKQRPEIWGSHGWERLWPDDRYQLADFDDDARQALAQATMCIDDVHKLGARTEQKPVSVAVHWRGLDARTAEQVRRRVVDHWAGLARRTPLAMLEFDGGLELRVPGRDKGHAVRTVAAEMPSDTVLAYLGDDSTDEDAFRALPDSGLGVLVRPAWRHTAAGLWITPPEEVLDFLTNWHEQTRMT